LAVVGAAGVAEEEVAVAPALAQRRSPPVSRSTRPSQPTPSAVARTGPAAGHSASKAARSRAPERAGEGEPLEWRPELVADRRGL